MSFDTELRINQECLTQKNRDLVIDSEPEIKLLLI